MRKLLIAVFSSLLVLSQTGCYATDKQPVESSQTAQGQMLKGGAAKNDVRSKRCAGESYFEAKETLEVILLGDRIVLEYQDGKIEEIGYFERRQPIVDGFWVGPFILTQMLTDFKKQKKIVGQANLSILVKDDHTCEILSKSLYVPGCEPYTGGADIPPRVQEFWQQIKSAVAAIEARDLKLPGPYVKSETLEIVIGRDPSMFPRYATPFNGMIVRDSNGRMIHVKAFVRDGLE